MRVKPVFSVRNLKTNLSIDFDSLDEANNFLDELGIEKRFSFSDSFQNEKDFFLFSILPLTQYSINFPFLSSKITKKSTMDIVPITETSFVIVFNYKTPNEKLIEMDLVDGKRKFKRIVIKQRDENYKYFNFHSKKIAYNRIMKSIENDLEEKILNETTGEVYTHKELRKKFGKYNYNLAIKAAKEKRELFGNKWRLLNEVRTA